MPFSLVAQQTHERLCAAIIIVFTDSVLPLSMGPTGIGAKVTASLLPTEFVAREDVRAMIAEAVALAVREAPPANKKYVPSKVSRTISSFYCYTHGPQTDGYPYTFHSSSECRHPKPDHKTDAHAGNHRGGAEVPTKYMKPR